MKIAHYLLEIGANINQKNEFGNTALHKAMMRGDKAVTLVVTFR